MNGNSREGNCVCVCVRERRYVCLYEINCQLELALSRLDDLTKLPRRVFIRASFFVSPNKLHQRDTQVFPEDPYGRTSDAMITERASSMDVDLPAVTQRSIDLVLAMGGERVVIWNRR
jgi:hypothetical protein